MHFLISSTTLKVVGPLTPNSSAKVLFQARPRCRAIKLCNKGRGLNTVASSDTGEDGDGKAKWEKLGLRKPLVEGLSRAYPNVVSPTRAQEQFIPAILGEGDVWVKDETGTGKYVIFIITITGSDFLEVFLLLWNLRA
jgi:hypothetical protein